MGPLAIPRYKSGLVADIERPARTDHHKSDALIDSGGINSMNKPMTVVPTRVATIAIDTADPGRPDFLTPTPPKRSPIPKNMAAKPPNKTVIFSSLLIVVEMYISN
jgi:hypothetical protein